MYHFILNPAASSGKGMQMWKKIEPVLQEEHVEYAAHVFKSSDETSEFIKDMTSVGKDACHFVILGGDGTINTVLNGIEDFSNTKISCIRTGSGNDFARNVGICKNPKKALQHLLHTPKQMCLDYGEACYTIQNKKVVRRFAISNGVGYDADICEEVSRSKLKKVLNRIKLGKLVYVLIGIKQIFTRKNEMAKITMDDASVMEIPGLFFVVGMIHEKEGGGVPFCPNADATDGLFDVCIVRNMPKFKLLLAVVLVYLKQHLCFKKITVHRCKKMVIQTDAPQWFHLDGDTSEQISEITLTCHSGLQFVK